MTSMRSTSISRQRRLGALALACALALAGGAPVALAQGRTRTSDPDPLIDSARRATTPETRRAALEAITTKEVDERAPDATPPPAPRERLLELATTGSDPQLRREALALALEAANEVAARTTDEQKAADARTSRLRAVEAILGGPLSDADADVRATALDGVRALYVGRSALAAPPAILERLSQMAARDAEPLLRIRALELLIEIAPDGVPTGRALAEAARDSHPAVAGRARALSQRRAR